MQIFIKSCSYAIIQYFYIKCNLGEGCPPPPAHTGPARASRALAQLVGKARRDAQGRQARGGKVLRWRAPHKGTRGARRARRDALAFLFTPIPAGGLSGILCNVCTKLIAPHRQTLRACRKLALGLVSLTSGPGFDATRMPGMGARQVLAEDMVSAP